MNWSLKVHHTLKASIPYLVKCKCQETTDNLKQMSRLTINFNLLQLIMFLLIYVNIKFCSSNTGMRTSAPLINAVVNNGLLHSNLRIKQIPPQIIYILPFCGRPAAQDFVMKCIEVWAVRWPVVWKFYGSLTLLHFPTGGANDAQNVSIDTAHRKDNDQQNL